MPDTPAPDRTTPAEGSANASDLPAAGAGSIREPLVPDLFAADPSAHVFDGRVYVYVSHDQDAGLPFDDEGGHFGGMVDYHLLTWQPPDGPAADLGPILNVDDVPWASGFMWAPDAAEAGGRYHLVFPAKDSAGLFRIGVAVADAPTGPFVAEPEPIAGTYSMDPTVFRDPDGSHLLLWGGLWGGQLQRYRDDRYDPAHGLPAPGEQALGPRIARLAPDLRSLVEPSREVLILDESGEPLREGDPRRFFEGAWMHVHDGRYHLSYSTGDSHLIVHAIGDDPYGPFTYAGVVLEPVVGWTTQHSIVEAGGRWWLFYHDAVASGGVHHLRSVKVAPLEHDAEGRIRTVSP